MIRFEKKWNIFIYVIYYFQFHRIKEQLETIIQRERELFEECRTLEGEYVDVKRLVDENKRKQSQFQQELQDADNDADKMASKESIYLEKQVICFLFFKIWYY